MAYSRNLSETLAPTVGGLGYELLGIDSMTGARGTLLRVFIDKEQGITVDDCERVSRQVADVIEADQLMRGEYTLEVSSPGVDRPLFTLEQLQKHIGAAVEIRVSHLVEGRRKIAGELTGVTNDVVSIIDTEQNYEVPFRLIERAKLVHKWTD